MLRFTIRDLLWLMVVVGLGTGWIFERHTLSTKLAEKDLYRKTKVWLMNTEEDTNPIGLRPGTKVLVEMDRDGAITKKTVP